MEGILRRSNNDMLALNLLRSLAKLYSGSKMRVSFWVWFLPLLGAYVADDDSGGGGPLDIV